MTRPVQASARSRAVWLSLIALTAATVVAYLLAPFVPNLSLGIVYLLAVLAVALNWGLAYAVPVALVGMLSFVWLFLPRLHTLSLRHWQEWVALGSYLVTMLLVGELAARARTRTADAYQREHEAAFLAATARDLLEDKNVWSGAGETQRRVTETLGVRWARLEPVPPQAATGDEVAWPLELAGECIGTLYVPSGTARNAAAIERIREPLATLLAIASERERLTAESLEAEALRRTDAAKTTILRALSHDLRSPLTAIHTAIEGLRGSLAFGRDDAPVLIDSILTETERLERLIQNLLDLSRIQSDAVGPLVESWSLDELVAGALETVVGADAGRIQISLPAEVPILMVDGVQVERALANLVENALKFSPASAPVDIAAECIDGRVDISVRDRGPGVAAEEIGRLFEPFERGSAREGRTGAGLGLAIARGFAEANGAEVSVRSTPGEGAVFTLSLPIVRVEEEMPA